MDDRTGERMEGGRETRLADLLLKRRHARLRGTLGRPRLVDAERRQGREGDFRAAEHPEARAGAGEETREASAAQPDSPFSQVYPGEGGDIRDIRSRQAGPAEPGPAREAAEPHQ